MLRLTVLLNLLYVLQRDEPLESLLPVLFGACVMFVGDPPALGAIKPQRRGRHVASTQSGLAIDCPYANITSVVFAACSSRPYFLKK